MGGRPSWIPHADYPQREKTMGGCVTVTSDWWLHTEGGARSVRISVRTSNVGVSCIHSQPTTTPATPHLIAVVLHTISFPSCFVRPNTQRPKICISVSLSVAGDFGLFRTKGLHLCFSNVSEKKRILILANKRNFR